MGFPLFPSFASCPLVTPHTGGVLRRVRGYSLYDLLVTLAVAGTLGVSAAGMSDVVATTRLTSEVNGMLAALHLARSEAIKRGDAVTLCASANGTTCGERSSWHQGWLMFADTNSNHRREDGEAIIRVQQGLSGNLTLRYGKNSEHGYVTYYPAGHVYPGTTFTFCDHRGAQQAKAIIILWTGRPRLSSLDSSDKPLKCSRPGTP